MRVRARERKREAGLVYLSLFIPQLLIMASCGLVQSYKPGAAGSPTRLIGCSSRNLNQKWSSVDLKQSLGCGLWMCILAHGTTMPAPQVCFEEWFM